MLKKTFKTAATLAIAGLALSGCKPTAPAAKVDPPVDQSTSAYACSGPESLATLKRIISQEAQKYTGDNSAGLDDAGVDDLMEFSLITISSVEPEIKKVSCEAQFGIRVPADAQDGLAGKNLIGNYLGRGFTGAMAVPEVPAELSRGDGSTITITYSRQRSADDQDYIFSLNNVGPIALALLRASSAVEATKARIDSPALGQGGSMAAGVFRRTSPALAELTLTQKGSAWHISIAGGAPDQGGSPPADCTIEADGQLADGEIRAKLAQEFLGSGHGQVTISPIADGLTVTDADVSGCGVGSDLDGKYLRTK